MLTSRPEGLSDCLIQKFYLYITLWATMASGGEPLGPSGLQVRAFSTTKLIASYAVPSHGIHARESLHRMWAMYPKADRPGGRHVVGSMTHWRPLGTGTWYRVMSRTWLRPGNRIPRHLTGCFGMSWPEPETWPGTPALPKVKVAASSDPSTVESEEEQHY